MSRTFDNFLLKEMMDEDDSDVMFGLTSDDNDGDLLDSLMETKSVNEELSELFPLEEKFMEVT